MDDIANESPDERQEIFRRTANAMGNASDRIIEKDFWVCWSLGKMFSLPSFKDHAIFKGGTSLSKAYNAIQRFSEDVDISLSRERLGFTGENAPDNPDLSNKKQKKLLEELESAAIQAVAGPILEELMTAFSAGLKQKFNIIVDPEDPQSLLFNYPTANMDNSDSYTRPQVKFEFGARGVQLPSNNLKISPYICKIEPGIEDVSVKVLGIERTFWEKATILHMLAHSSPDRPLANRMSRHYYDMAMLIEHEAKSHALANIDMLAEVAHHKSVYFKAAWAKYDEAKPGMLRLMPNAKLEAALRQDYKNMGEMIFGKPPEFDAILAKIKGFEDEVNGK